MAKIEITKTELVWPGKYNEDGTLEEVPRVSLPFQVIETVNESRATREANKLPNQGSLFDVYEGKEGDTFEEGWRNKLIWGDNLLVMGSLLEKFAGKIDLIYIDPPFDVGADFSMKVPIGDDKDTIGKDQSTLEMVAYRDTWGKGTDSYLFMMYERLVLLRELLSETGTIYIHADWHVGHYLKVICYDVFGEENFINEITWHYYNKMAPISRCFPRASDRIISFSRTVGRHTFKQQYEKRDKPVKQLKRKFVNGKAINVRDEAGNVQYQMKDTRRLDDVWRISMLQPADKTQYLAYGTQKPEGVLERIINASSNEGDLVADFFCGSGTTGAVAERLGRRWIMADLGRFAIHTSRKRLIELQRKLHKEGQPYRAFDVYNLGRYERQWWQQERLAGADEEHRRVVLEFFRAEVLDSKQTSSPLIHGRKGQAFCHVDGIDSLFIREEATAVANAVAQAGGRECYCLAWEFEMDLRLHTAALAAELGVKLKLIQIPREIMEKNRTSPPPFLEVAVLEAEPVYRVGTLTPALSQGERGKCVDIKLTEFLPSLAEVPSKELEAIKERAMKSGMDFVDFWSVDFDWQPGKPFNHHWQDYRTRKDRDRKSTRLNSSHTDISRMPSSA